MASDQHPERSSPFVDCSGRSEPLSDEHQSNAMTCLSAAENDMMSMSEHTASLCLSRCAEEVELGMQSLLACRLSAARLSQSLALALAVVNHVLQHC